WLRASIASRVIRYLFPSAAISGTTTALSPWRWQISMPRSRVTRSLGSWRIIRMVSRTPNSGKRLKKGDSVSLTSSALSKELSKTGSPVLLTKFARRTTSVSVSTGRAKTMRHEVTAATRRKAARPAAKIMRRLFDSCGLCGTRAAGARSCSTGADTGRPTSPFSTRARKRFDIARLFGRIAQGITQLLDRVVQTCIEVNKGVRRPKLLPEFVARNQVARMFEQKCKQLEGLILQFQADAVLVELT